MKRRLCGLRRPTQTQKDRLIGKFGLTQGQQRIPMEQKMAGPSLFAAKVPHHPRKLSLQPAAGWLAHQLDWRELTARRTSKLAEKFELRMRSLENKTPQQLTSGHWLVGVAAALEKSFGTDSSDSGYLYLHPLRSTASIVPNSPPPRAV